MKHLTLFAIAVLSITLLQSACGAPAEPKSDEISASFGFKQDNGYQREEEVKYNRGAIANQSSEKPVEYKGGYSYISADGYEYTVKYKANKNGFQPYVTAHKLKTDTSDKKKNI